MEKKKRRIKSKAYLENVEKRKRTIKKEAKLPERSLPSVNSLVSLEVCTVSEHFTAVREVTFVRPDKISSF